MKWDYIVVAAGSAGCAVAYELIRSGRHKVPDLTSGNTNAVCMMIGAKLGKSLASRPARP